MITFLRKRKQNKTPKKIIHESGFKKPLIRIIDNNQKNPDDTIKDNKDDDDDDIQINTSKINNIASKIKISKEELKKSVMTNATVVKELLIKTVDKHKIELCTQMATQLVEIYNNKHKNDSNEDHNDSNEDHNDSNEDHNDSNEDHNDSNEDHIENS
jgi:hypothetical protein